MDGFWTVLFMGVVLKIPLALMVGIIWWALRQQPDPVTDEDEGGTKHGRERAPAGPRGPRRGPHPTAPAEPPPCPPGGRSRRSREPAPVRARRSGAGQRGHAEARD